jgi:hypothetical protein
MKVQEICTKRCKHVLFVNEDNDEKWRGILEVWTVFYHQNSNDQANWGLFSKQAEIDLSMVFNQYLRY